MKPQPSLAIVFAALWLTGCAGGGGSMLAEPTVSQVDVNHARQALSTHRLEPSRNLANSEMQSTLDRVWDSLKSPLIQTCSRVFSSGCWNSINSMRVIAVNRNDVNAYADASKFTIGVHAGFLRVAGDDDEVAAVLAHEAAHLLFSHAQKKMTNATNAQLATGALALALGAALQSPAILDQAGDMSMAGYEAGYVAYSPEMEIEADQFAMYVLKQANRRLTAGTDLIVRLHRGDVPASVRRGDGWASYLSTHPADDYRLAAMRNTLQEIQRGAIRPLSKQEALHRAWERRQEEERRRTEAQQRQREEEARSQAAADLRMCRKLREEYPKCDLFQGKWFDLTYLIDCPSQFHSDTHSAIRGCNQLLAQ